MFNYSCNNLILDTMGYSVLLYLGIICVTYASGMNQSDCVEGEYWSGFSCLLCHRGSYNPYPAQVNCTWCPRDKLDRPGTTRLTGAVNVTECYFDPIIDGFFPTYGPEAGGTMVQINLTHAENVAVTYVTSADSFCAIVNTTRGNSQVLCRTDPVRAKQQGAVKVTFSNDRMTSSGEMWYSYKPNPEITSISSLKTFISGGIVLRVYGRNLDSVARPYLIVVRVYLGVPKIYYSLCTVISSEEMHCPTPNLGLGLRTKRDTSNPRPLNDLSTQFYAGLQLDGLNTYTNLSTALPDTGQLLVYPDPIYFPFEEERGIRYFDPKDEDQLNIKGKYLNYASTIEDVIVTVGQGQCNVTFLATNLLTCRPPQHQPPPEDKGAKLKDLPRVTVYVGNLIYVIGYLDYSEPVTQRPDPSDDGTNWMLIVLVAVVIVVTILFVVAIVVACMFNKKRKEKRVHLSAFVENGRERRYVGRSAPGLIYSRMSENSGSSSSGSVQSTTPINPGRHMSLSISPPQTPGDPWDNVTATSVFAYPDENRNSRNILNEVDSNLMMSIQSCLIESNDISIGEVIGVGYFGKVFKGTIATEGDENETTVAIKTVQGKHSTLKEINAFLEEALLMKDFKHENVLSLVGVALKNNRPLVILPYMERGDLKTYIKDPSRKLKVRELLAFGLQIAHGMVYLSDLKFIHRDLATRNCMLNREMVVKIADFGLSRDVYKSNYYRVEDKHRPLPVRWMAVESLTLGVFTAKSDVWSFGVTLWELMTRGCSPYPDVDTFNIKNYVTDGHRLSQPSHTPDEIYFLMSSCWRDSPSDRPSFTDLQANITKILGQNEATEEQSQYTEIVDAVIDN